MASIKYNVKGVETSGGDPVPPGVYKAKLTAAPVTQPEGKGQRIEAEFTLHGGPHNGRKLYDYILTTQENMAWKLAGFVRAFGLPDTGSLDPEKKLVGKVIQIRVRLENDNREGHEGEKQARIGGYIPFEEDDEDDEDLDEETAGEEGAPDEESSEDTYTLEELNDLDKAELIELAEEWEIEAPSRFTAAAKKKLAQAIFDAQEGGDEDEEEDEEDGDEEEEDDEGIDLDALDRAELKALIKEQGLEIRILKSKSDDDLRAEIAEAMGAEDEEGSDEEEDDEEDDEEEGADYASMSPADLKALLTERKLPTKGPKSTLVARLEKDDAANGDPF